MNIRNYINRTLDGIKTSVVVICCILFWSCSFDEPWDDLSTTTVNDDKAYIAVELTAGSSPLLMASTTNNVSPENTVNNVHFYFYDQNGIFVSQGSVTATVAGWVDGDGTIVELYNSNPLVMLKGLTGRGYPLYVVTVVNLPESSTFEHTTKLEDMLSKMSDASNSGIGTDNAFVMTSSTYIPTGDAPYSAVPYQFYTVLTEDDFISTTENLTTANSIDIPVERLAAKVTVTLDLDEADNKTTINGTIDGTSEEYTVYKVNDEPEQYVQLLGWKINAVARDSYMFKNLKDEWATTPPWTGWNDPGNTRCYWAKSYYYGADDYAYPLENITNTPTEEDISTEWLSPYVKYVSLDDDYDGDLIEFGADGYCPENTNSVGDDGIIEDQKSTALTCVLIKARGWVKNSDDEYVPLVSVMGNDEGLMYYSLPIRHVNYQGGTTIEEGEYGVVRNHHYTVKITGVNHLGTGIGEDTGIVIVPEYEQTLSMTGLSALWSSREETINQGDEFIDVTIPDTTPDN